MVSKGNIWWTEEEIRNLQLTYIYLYIYIHTHTIIYKINNKDLLYSTGNFIQFLQLPYNETEKEYRSITELFCCTYETNTTL